MSRPAASIQFALRSSRQADARPIFKLYKFITAPDLARCVVEDGTSWNDRRGARERYGEDHIRCRMLDRIVVNNQAAVVVPPRSTGGFGIGPFLHFLFFVQMLSTGSKEFRAINDFPR